MNKRFLTNSILGMLLVLAIQVQAQQQPAQMQRLLKQTRFNITNNQIYRIKLGLPLSSDETHYTFLTLEPEATSHLYDIEDRKGPILIITSRGVHKVQLHGNSVDDDFRAWIAKDVKSWTENFKPIARFRLNPEGGSAYSLNFRLTPTEGLKIKENRAGLQAQQRQ